MAWTRVGCLAVAVAGPPGPAATATLRVVRTSGDCTVRSGNTLVVVTAQKATVQLPDAAACAGEWVIVKNAGTGMLTTLEAQEGQREGGAHSDTLVLAAAWGSMRLCSDGFCWLSV